MMRQRTIGLMIGAVVSVGTTPAWGDDLARFDLNHDGRLDPGPEKRLAPSVGSSSSTLVSRS
jgi:hypothetical protein